MVAPLPITPNSLIGLKRTTNYQKGIVVYCGLSLRVLVHIAQCKHPCVHQSQKHNIWWPQDSTIYASVYQNWRFFVLVTLHWRLLEHSCRDSSRLLCLPFPSQIAAGKKVIEHTIVSDDEDNGKAFLADCQHSGITQVLLKSARDYRSGTQHINHYLHISTEAAWWATFSSTKQGTQNSMRISHQMRI